MFWGTWAVALANVQATFGLSDGQLGILLAVSIALAGITGAVISHHAERFGSGRMLAGALGVWAVLLVGAGLAPTLPFFVVALGLTEVAGGCVATTMNAASAARLMGRPGALVRFHAFFNTGALLGAAVAGIVLHAGISWRWLWPTLALVAAALAVWTRRTVGEATLPALPTGLAPGASGDGGDTRGPLRRLRRDGLLLLLFIFALAEVTEGGVDTWGVLYLRTHLAAGVLLGAGAYVVGQSVAALTRGAGGPVLGRLSPRIALVVGGSIASAGILVESVSPDAVVAAVGLALGAAGASLFWPLVMSDVSRVASRPTSAVGTFTGAGYCGLVAGAPLVGWVSDTYGLNRGLQVLAGAAALVALTSLFSPALSPHTKRGG